MTIEIDVPSAFQVRIAGCKGMLMVDPESKLSDHYIKVRPSMKKFDSDDWSLYVVDHSRPSKVSNQLPMQPCSQHFVDFIFKCH